MPDDSKKIRKQWQNFIETCPEAVRWFARACYVNKTAFHPGDPAVRDFREGRRSVFYDVISFAKLPDSFFENSKEDFFAV